MGARRRVRPDSSVPGRRHRTEHYLTARTHRHRLGVRLRPHRRIRASGAGLQAALQARQLLLIGAPARRARRWTSSSSLREIVMRRVVTLCAWIGFLAVAPAATQARAQAQPGLKIAFISSQQILEQTPGYAAAESTFKKEYQGFQDEAQKLKQQFDSAVQVFEKQSIALSSSAKQAKQKELQQLQQRLEQRSSELQDKSQQRQRRDPGAARRRQLRADFRRGLAHQQYRRRRPEPRYHPQGDRAAEAGEVGHAQPVRGRPASEGTAGGGDPGGRGAGAARRISAREIAALTNGRLVGAPDVTVSGVAPLDRAGPDDRTFLAAKRYLQYFQQSSAAIVLCKPDLVPDDAGAGPACRVVVRDPHVALLSVIPVLYPEPAWKPGIHRTAVIGEGVVWQEPVAIGPYAVLGRGVRLGKNVRIGAAAVLGDGVELGDDVQLLPHVVCYSGTIVGNRVILHAGVRLGSDGFGYVPGKNGEMPRKIPQVGRCIIGDDVEIGANTTIDRGSVDDTVVGPGTKIDNLVQLGHNCRIGARCLIAGQAGIAGSTHVEDDVFLAGQAGLADHVTIGKGARVTVQGGVISDIDPGATVSGYPARSHREFLRAQGALYRLAKIVDDLEALVQRSRESDR